MREYKCPHCGAINPAPTETRNIHRRNYIHIMRCISCKEFWEQEIEVAKI